MSASAALGRHALAEPLPERLDLLFRPGAVAGHVASLQPLEDPLCVLPHVLMAPEVEGPLHLVPVVLAEQGPDVLFEASQTSSSSCGGTGSGGPPRHLPVRRYCGAAAGAGRAAGLRAPRPAWARSPPWALGWVGGWG